MTALTQPDHPGAYLSVAEVAAELGCSEPTVRRRIRTGELPPVKLGEGRNSAVRVPRAGLEAWLWGPRKRMSNRLDLAGTDLLGAISSAHPRFF